MLHLTCAWGIERVRQGGRGAQAAIGAGFAKTPHWRVAKKMSASARQKRGVGLASHHGQRRAVVFIAAFGVKEGQGAGAGVLRGGYA